MDVKPTGTPILLTFCCVILGARHPHLRSGVSPDPPGPTFKFQWEREQEGGRRGLFQLNPPPLQGLPGGPHEGATWRSMTMETRLHRAGKLEMQVLSVCVVVPIKLLLLTAVIQEFCWPGIRG